jgi:asparagine synthase (glutamine-hydrolysing)
MCGIAGTLNFDGRPADPVLLARMAQALRHRGPDAEATHIDGPAGLAHARLSILDLPGGRQPMCNEDRSVWVTYNGEIFNYVELREELVSKGHVFATSSDTEVLVHLYEEEGPECVQRLNGQWAFAIWDRKRQILFASRDRFGVRPFFYTVVKGELVFGSEIKALLAHPDVAADIDLVTLDQIFTFWAPLPPRTIFRGIFQLAPGHSLTVKDGHVEERAYWQLDYGVSDECDTGRDQQKAEMLRALLADATRIRLRSDVPVGAYLSGGLDSTVVTALAKTSLESLKTFSVTFDDPEFDERQYQAAAIGTIGTDHSEIRCAPAQIARVFPDVIWHTEQPILRTAPAPLFLLSKLVRDSGTKVVLTGEGADEILGGYDIFKEAKIRRFWSARPRSSWRSLLLKRMYPYLPNLTRQSEAYLEAFFHVGASAQSSPFFSHLPRWELTSKLKTFFSDDVRAELAGYDSYADALRQLPAGYRGWDPFCQAQYLEAAMLLPGYILSAQGDRMAMAHSVEGRFPFLDHRVVEFAATLPPRLKMKALNEKYLLKRCTRDIVPRAITTRRKQPYRAPEATSFMSGAAPAYVEELLSPAQIRRTGLFNPTAVRKLVEKHKAGRALGVKDNMALVGILSSELVVDSFLNNFRGKARYAA